MARFMFVDLNNRHALNKSRLFFEVWTLALLFFKLTEDRFFKTETSAIAVHWPLNVKQNLCVPWGTQGKSYPKVKAWRHKFFCDYSAEYQPVYSLPRRLPQLPVEDSTTHGASICAFLWDRHPRPSRDWRFWNVLGPSRAHSKSPVSGLTGVIWPIVSIKLEPCMVKYNLRLWIWLDFCML